MSDFDIFPDSEALISAELRSILSVGVYSGVPKAPTFPFIIVQRIGGVPAERHRLDRARLQVSSFGRNKTEALAVAQEARIAIMDLEGTALPGAWVSGIEDDLGLQYTIDPETGRDRYVFGVSVYIHSDTSGSSGSSGSS